MRFLQINWQRNANSNPHRKLQAYIPTYIVVIKKKRKARSRESHELPPTDSFDEIFVKRCYRGQYTLKQPLLEIKK